MSKIEIIIIIIVNIIYLTGTIICIIDSIRGKKVIATILLIIFLGIAPLFYIPYFKDLKLKTIAKRFIFIGLFLAIILFIFYFFRDLTFLGKNG